MKPRLRFFKKHGLQIKYLALMIIAMVVPALLVGGCLYYLIFNLLAEQLGIPEVVAYNLIPVVEKINVMLALGLPPVFLIVLLWGLALSHRFVGPLERLEEDIRKISEGDYSIRLKLRKDDDLKPIADTVNKLIDRLEKAG